jgi:PAS domain S-box-containing protein
MSARPHALAASEARVRELEAALQEANDTIDAIRNGDVDAVVVGGPRGQVVYTLESADRPYRVLVEQMREGAVTLNAQGTILYCNQSFAELISRRTEEIIGKSIFDFVAEAAELEAMLARAGPVGASAELSLRLPGGQAAQANLSVVNLVVDPGDAAMACLIVTDLRQNYERAREIAQANLQLASEIAERARAEQSLAIALDAADMGHWDLDLVAGRSVRSARHDAIFGYAEPPAAWGVEQAAAHFLPEDRQDFLDAMARAVVSGRVDIERRIRRAGDGALRWVHVKGRTFYQDGRAERMVGVVVDTTERRQMDEALRQGQKMEAIGQLTGGIAHDFNNLLMIIGGSLESFARRVQLDERMQRLLDAARLGVARGARLNQQLLAFARRQDLHEEAICVTDLLPDFEILLDRAMGEAVSIKVERPEQLWYCRADPHQLETAILNLAINARDAMNERGQLVLGSANAVVTAAQAEANGAAPGDYVVITVADDGPGIASDVVARVFEPFFTTKPIGKGTGLGLSQVYGFARQTGGFVELESQLGAGTKVSIFLPRTDPPPFKAAVVEPAPAKPADGTVLLVEDDVDVRGAARAMLEELGYGVIEAVSADAALSLVADGGDVDLVFSDVIMASGMSGIEMARSIMTTRPDLPVLLTSGYTAQRLMADAMSGDLPVLRKPYTLAQLADALSRLQRVP